MSAQLRQKTQLPIYQLHPIFMLLYKTPPARTLRGAKVFLSHRQRPEICNRTPERGNFARSLLKVSVPTSGSRDVQGTCAQDTEACGRFGESQCDENTQPKTTLLGPRAPLALGCAATDAAGRRHRKGTNGD